MARRTQKQEQNLEKAFVYREFVGTKLWQCLDRAVRALTKNGDLVALTPRRYIVGYLAKAVSELPTVTVGQKPSVRRRSTRER